MVNLAEPQLSWELLTGGGCMWRCRVGFLSYVEEVSFQAAELCEQC